MIWLRGQATLVVFASKHRSHPPEKALPNLPETRRGAFSRIDKRTLTMAEAGAAKKLINQPDNVVDEAIDGLLLTSPGLRRLEGYTVLVREKLDKSKVAVVSGGGSGHEPSHGGWVGEGMLSAAVPGAVFASPSTASVLAAILHVTGAGGCLVIVKNYTGDRLNFGLACEQAKAAGLKVEMLVVGEDCALPHRTGGLAGRRGVAGTVLVHKVAGAAAEAGLSLEQARRAAPATVQPSPSLPSRTPHARMRSLTRLSCLFRAGGSGGRGGGSGMWQHGCGTRIVLAPRQAR
jgi:hypothetical protein